MSPNPDVITSSPVTSGSCVQWHHRSKHCGNHCCRLYWPRWAIDPDKYRADSYIPMMQKHCTFLSPTASRSYDAKALGTGKTPHHKPIVTGNRKKETNSIGSTSLVFSSLPVLHIVLHRKQWKLSKGSGVTENIVFNIMPEQNHFFIFIFTDGKKLSIVLLLLTEKQSDSLQN